MYLDALHMVDFKSYKDQTIRFNFPKQSAIRKPFDNVTLLLGGNATGKTSILRAISLAILGSSLSNAGFRQLNLVRKDPDQSINQCTIEAALQLPDQQVSAKVVIDDKRGIQEGLSSSFPEMFEDASPKFFLAGYAASRWVGTAGQHDLPSIRDKVRSRRYQRVASLFEENFNLMPLEVSIPKILPRTGELLKELLLPAELSPVILEGPLTFKRDQISLPFEALSDGHRSYIAWLGDLLYHLDAIVQPGLHASFLDSPGVVLVDEIDLHLHPSWQKTIIEKISTTFPNLQFIFTSHSPLVASSLPTSHVLLVSYQDNLSNARALDANLQGLNADQALLTPYFGLKSTRASGFESELKKLYLQAKDGDDNARLEILKLYARGVSEHD